MELPVNVNVALEFEPTDPLISIPTSRSLVTWTVTGGLEFV